jgi:amidase
VADAAALLTIIAGADPNDPATVDAAGAARQLAELTLDPAALSGVRVGVVRTQGEVEAQPDPHRVACHDQALAAMARAGAELIDVHLPSPSSEDELTVLHYEFAPAVGAYLSALGSGAMLRSLADIQAWNREHAQVALKFGQVHVDIAVAVDHERERDAYRRARERDRRTAEAALSAGLGDDCQCLVFPGADGRSWAARAGWPSIVLPAGYAANNRRPVGLMLVSRPWTDARLLQLAYAVEQAHPVRRSPAEINPAQFRHPQP